MHLGRDGRAIDKHFSGGVGEQRVAFRRVDFSHGVIVGNDGDDYIRQFGDSGELLWSLRAEFLRNRVSDIFARVKNGSDLEAAILETARHVRAHSANANKTNSFSHMYPF